MEHGIDKTETCREEKNQEGRSRCKKKADDCASPEADSNCDR